MSSSHIQALLAPPSIQDSHNNAVAFLNSQYKTLQDIEDSADFDVIVENTHSESQALKEKLSQSQARIDALISQTRTSAEEHLHTAQELSLLRHSLADELAYLSQELVSSVAGPDGKPTLLEDIETLHRNLKELESIKGYVQVIAHGLQLSEAAVQQIKDNHSPLSSVSRYEDLIRFVSSVTEACENVADASGTQTLHLVTFLEGVKDRTWQEMKQTLFSSLLAPAEQLGWPSVIDYSAANVSTRKSFESSFANLLKLQRIGDTLHTSTSSKLEKEGLYPLQALVQPIFLRFKYHFEGSRQTNRLDKPEWYFTHVINAAHEHRPFMEHIIQQLLSNTEHRQIDAWREFTWLLLPLLTRKLKRTVPSLLSHSSLLAHTIYQALAFDSSIKEEGFDVANTSGSIQPQPGAGEHDKDVHAWPGICDVILGRKEWFDAWLEGERKFAMDQYTESISTPDAWLIADDDGGEEGHISQLKPTNSARRVKALVEQVTERYSPLPQFGHRTRFLIAVQLPILESYHSRISSSLDAFETLSSSFMRAVPGALGGDGPGRSSDSRRMTSGVEGTQRLCKALLSAKYMSAAMEGWGEDLFFLELWAEINHKASLRSRAESVASLPDPKATHSEVPEGTIFEELVQQYDKLSGRAEELIIQTVCAEVEIGLKAHFSGGSSQSTPVPSSSEDDIALSATLLGPIALLSSHLTFLRSTLPEATVTNVYRQTASRLALHILHRQIMYRGRARITPQQGKIILAECELWAETCWIALGRLGSLRTEAPWRGLLEAARIVAADGDAWQRIKDHTFGMGGDEEWERVMVESVGLAELPREEVGQIIRTRVDVD